MKKILVPTDFSYNALQAAAFAAEMAQKANATIYLIHVLEGGNEKIFQPLPLYDKYKDLSLSDRKEELEAFEDKVSQLYPEVRIKAEITGHAPVGGIIAYSRTVGADLIVMGTKGATRLKEVFMGSVAAGVIQKSEIPVLAVPATTKVVQIDTILFATSHFEENRAILDVITRIASLYGATIRVAVFMDTDTASAAEYMDSTRRLERYKTFLKDSYPRIPFTFTLIEGRHFENSIEDYCIENGVDLIALIPYPKTFFEKMIHSPATQRMAFHSAIPILTIPYDLEEKSTAGEKKQMPLASE
jgi:nucleotide-binding universal stress UspA family protein